MEKTYCFLTPGNFLALEFRARSKAEARADFLRWAKLDRLPRNTQIWTRGKNDNKS